MACRISEKSRLHGKIVPCFAQNRPFYLAFYVNVIQLYWIFSFHTIVAKPMVCNKAYLVFCLGPFWLDIHAIANAPLWPVLTSKLYCKLIKRWQECRRKFLFYYSIIFIHSTILQNERRRRRRTRRRMIRKRRWVLWGDNYFFFLFKYTHHALPHFLFTITKGSQLPFAAKGRPIRMGLLPHAEIRTRQMGEMEEEIAECYGEGLIFSPFNSFNHSPFLPHFLFIIFQTKRNEPSVCNNSNEMNGSNGGGEMWVLRHVKFFIHSNPFNHSPAFLPHFLFIILQMKGMNLLFAAIQTRWMRDIEEEKWECYGRLIF